MQVGDTWWVVVLGRLTASTSPAAGWQQRGDCGCTKACCLKAEDAAFSRNCACTSSARWKDGPEYRQGLLAVLKQLSIEYQNTDVVKPSEIVSVAVELIDTGIFICQHKALLIAVWL